MTLTPAQERILTEVRATGRKVYEGRSYPAIAALESLGLVAVQTNLIEVDVIASTGRGRHTKSYTVTPPNHVG